MIRKGEAISNESPLVGTDFADQLRREEILTTNATIDREARRDPRPAAIFR
jgi:hypothetical protein